MTESVENATGKPETVLDPENAEALAKIAEAEEKPAGAEADAEKPDELATWKGHARKHEDRAKALSAELESVRAELAEAAKASARVSELEARATRAELAAEVAVAKGVKLRYLAGETREELEASADEWLNDAKSIGRVGVVPTQGTGDVAPRASSYEAGAQRAREKHSKQKGEAA